MLTRSPDIAPQCDRDPIGEPPFVSIDLLAAAATRKVMPPIMPMVDAALFRQEATGAEQVPFGD